VPVRRGDTKGSQTRDGIDRGRGEWAKEPPPRRRAPGAKPRGYESRPDGRSVAFCVGWCYAAAMPMIGALGGELPRLPTKARSEKSNTPPSEATMR
jgi:hypothetical protein